MPFHYNRCLSHLIRLVKNNREVLGLTVLWRVQTILAPNVIQGTPQYQLAAWLPTHPPSGVLNFQGLGGGCIVWLYVEYNGFIIGSLLRCGCDIKSQIGNTGEVDSKQLLFPLEMQLTVDDFKKNIFSVTYFLQVAILSTIFRYQAVRLKWHWAILWHRQLFSMKKCKHVAI